MNLSAQVAGAFEPLLAEALEAVAALDDETCNQPLSVPKTNTVAALVTHAVESTRFWLHLGLTGENLPRDRAAEFRSWAGRGQLLAALEELRAWLHEEVAGAPLDPSAIRHPVAAASGGRGEPISAGECLLRTLAHFATHLGHLQLTAQLVASAAHRTDS